jgi:hypothetical protein
MNAMERQLNSIISGESFLTSSATANILIENANIFRPNQYRTIELRGLARFEFAESPKEVSFNEMFESLFGGLNKC